MGQAVPQTLRLGRREHQNIEETLSFYRLPRQHHKNLKSTNMLERFMEEIKRRTLVVPIFPNAAACLRLVAPSLLKPMRTGSRPCSTSIWNRSRNRKKRPCGN